MNDTTHRPEAAPASAPTPATVRVLVVDDDAEMRRYLLLGIERGWRRPAVVTVCGDGAEALRLVREAGFDLVITDVRLPGMDGLAICEALAHDARHARVPVLIVTGDPDCVERAETLARAQARRALLTKPFNAADLAAALDQLLEAR